MKKPNRAPRIAQESQDVQFIGIDGTVFRIPAAALRQFAISKETAWDVHDTAPIRNERVILLTGSDKSVASAPPKMLFRLIKASLEENFYDDLEKLIAAYPHQLYIPAMVLDELRHISNGKRPRQSPQRGAYSPISALEFARIAKSAILAKRYPALLGVVSKHLDKIALSLPTPLVNNVKFLLASKTGGRPNPSKDIFLLSSCGCRGSAGGRDGDGGSGGAGGSGGSGGGGSEGRGGESGCRETSDTGMTGCPG